jgi:N-acetylglucosaminyl-diphospho-decaprenol L-rhamnosyltransferase
VLKPSEQSNAVNQDFDFDLSVLIINYNTPHLLPELFRTLHASLTRIKYEIIFVDNASKVNCRSAVEMLEPKVVFIQNTANVGFGRANNQAAEVARGKYLLLLNTDAFVAEDSVGKTLEYMNSHPECGILGVRLIGRDNMLQPSCRFFPTPINTFLRRTGLERFFPRSKPVDDFSWDHASVRECDWVTGCYFLIRAAVVEKAGLFDPRYFMYCEEVDLCRAAKKLGWKVIYYPFTSVIHLGGESAKTVGALTSSAQLSNFQVESELLYFRKHYALSGVTLHLLLVTVASIYAGLAGMLKRRTLSGFKYGIAQTTLNWRLFFQTKCARVATR